MTSPRTAVGIGGDGKLILVSAASASIQQLREIMLALGCVEAMNLDGGGSTTVVTTAETGALHVCNVVSDPVLRPVADALLITARD